MQRLPQEAAAVVKEAVAREAVTAWPDAGLASRVEEYLNFVRTVPTPNVRGTSTWYAEITQDQQQLQE